MRHSEINHFYSICLENGSVLNSFFVNFISVLCVNCVMSSISVWFVFMNVHSMSLSLGIVLVCWESYDRGGIEMKMSG